MSFSDSKKVVVPKADPVKKYGKTFQVANIYLTHSEYAREDSIVPEFHALLSTHHQNFQGEELNLHWNLKEPRDGLIYDSQDIFNNSYISGFNVSIYENLDEEKRKKVRGNRNKIFETNDLTDNSLLYYISGDRKIRNYSVDVEVVDFAGNKSSGIFTTKNPPPEYTILSESFEGGILTINYEGLKDTDGNDISNNFQTLELYHFTGLTSGVSGVVNQEDDYFNTAVRSVTGLNNSLSIELYPEEFNYLMPLGVDQFSTGNNNNNYSVRQYQPYISSLYGQRISGGDAYYFTFDKNYSSDTQFVEACYGLTGEGETSQAVYGYNDIIYLDSGVMDSEAYYGANEENQYIFDNSLHFQDSFYTGLFIDSTGDGITGYIGSGAGSSWANSSPIYLEESLNSYNVYNYGFYNAGEQAFACSTSGLNEEIIGTYSMPKDNPNSYDIKFRSGDRFSRTLEESASYLNEIGEMPAVILNPYQLELIKTMGHGNGWVGLRRNKVGMLSGAFSERFLNDEIFLEVDFQQESQRTIETINSENEIEYGVITSNDVGNHWCWANSNGSHIYKYAGSGYGKVREARLSIDLKNKVRGNTMNSYTATGLSPIMEFSGVSISTDSQNFESNYTFVDTFYNPQESQGYLANNYNVTGIYLYGSDQQDFEATENNLLEVYSQEAGDIQNNIMHAFDGEGNPHKYIKMIPYDTIGSGILHEGDFVLTKSSQITILNLDEAKDANQNWISGSFDYHHNTEPDLTFGVYYSGDPAGFTNISATVSGSPTTEGAVFFLSSIPSEYGYTLHINSVDQT